MSRAEDIERLAQMIRETCAKSSPGASEYVIAESLIRMGITVPSEEIKCGCFSCMSQVKTYMGLPVTMTVMIVCPFCGNKRCPRATHHDQKCTGSNDPGQEGSRYS